MTSPRRAAAPTTTTSGPKARAWRARLRRLAPTLSRNLPWTGLDDPWAIAVSELMLQQTQVSRVLPIWRAFLDQFPTPAACAAAPTSAVVRAWAGLGYHRRALFLQRAAQDMVRDHGGLVPSEVSALEALPGFGAYTARAVASFAFGRPVGILDTNVGRVLSRAVTGVTLTRSQAQGWADAIAGTVESGVLNQALLDLGAQYCTSTPRCVDCPVRRACLWRGVGPDPAARSAAVSKAQSRFAGSRRQRRGQLLAALRERSLTDAEATALVGADGPDILDAFVTEGMAKRTSRRVRLA